MDKILGDPRVVFDECELCVTSYRDECVLLVVMIRWVEEVLALFKINSAGVTPVDTLHHE